MPIINNQAVANIIPESLLQSLPLASKTKAGIVSAGTHLEVTKSGELNVVGVPTTEEMQEAISVYADTQYSKYTVLEQDVSRFSADCWTVDGNLDASFCIYSEQENSFTAAFTTRYTDDFVAAIFFSEDKAAHAYLSYETKRNYENCVLNFSLDLSSSLAAIADEQAGTVITVITLDDEGKEVPYFIRVANYADASTLTSHHADISLDWDKVQAGFYADTPFPKTNIDRIFIGCITASYDSTQHTPLAEHESGTITVSNMTTSGSNSTYIRKQVSVAQHTVGICTSYDDSYNVNPARIIKNCYDLGYRGHFNHYAGMSHYPDKLYNESQMRFVVTKPTNKPTHNLVNKETTLWHKYLAKEAKAHLMTPIISVSFEMFSLYAELDWTQRDINDNYGHTGYEPPSYLMSPCIPEAMTYLQEVTKEFADVLKEEGHVPHLQVGEPWWWSNTDGKPCIYDYPTKLKFFNETGMYAPAISNMQDMQDTTEFKAYLEFLRKELGNAVVSVRTAVKAKYPEAMVSTLFFLPSILGDMTSIAATINYPVDQYKYPNLDFIQTETYDWLVVGEFNKALRGFTSAIDELGYPPHLVHYLAGFVPDNVLGKLITPDYELDVDGVKVWQAIIGNMCLGKEYGVAKQHIWAYNQVVRDSLVIVPQENLKRFWLKDDLYTSQLTELGVRGTPVINIPMNPSRPHEPESPPQE